jgi:DNA-binding beta-propeller fold protein YncE
LSLESEIDRSTYGGGANSVSAFDGVIAIAVQGATTATRGKVVFFDSDGTFIVDLEAGYLPDMVTFSHDGKMVVVANEGEPNDDWTEDPDGSVSIIDVSGGIESVTQSNVTELVIGDYTGSWYGIRVFGPDSNQDVASNMEPEYVAISEDNSKAFISFQENNAVAVIDLTSKTITDIQPLG